MPRVNRKQESKTRNRVPQASRSVQFEKARARAVINYLDALAESVHKDAPEKKVKHVYQSN